jgi:GT2 family glycosyltransferase
VSVLAFNSGEKILSTLRSLAAQSYSNFDLELVDNCSDDGTPALVGREFPQVRVSVLPRNLGYTGGANVILAEAIKRSYDCVAICNHDVEVDGDAIQKLVETARGFPHAGLVGAIEHNVRLRRLRAASGGEFSLWLSKLKWIDQLRGPQHTVEAFCAQGALVLLTKKALAAGVSFDEDLFMYFDEADMGFQLRRRDLQTVIDRRVVVKHYGAPEYAPFIGYWMQRNRLYMVTKHGRWYHQVFYVLYSSAIELPAKLVFRALQGRFRFALACLAGQIDGLYYSCRPGHMRKRKLFTWIWLNPN